MHISPLDQNGIISWEMTGDARISSTAYATSCLSLWSLSCLHFEKDVQMNIEALVRLFKTQENVNLHALSRVRVIMFSVAAPPARVMSAD